MTLRPEGTYLGPMARAQWPIPQTIRFLSLVMGSLADE